jgi:hypothetical protein
MPFIDAKSSINGVYTEGSLFQQKTLNLVKQLKDFYKNSELISQQTKATIRK